MYGMDFQLTRFFSNTELLSLNCRLSCPSKAQSSHSSQEGCWMFSNHFYPDWEGLDEFNPLAQ